MRHGTALVAFLALTVGGGLLIGFLTLPGEWYAALAKPGFTPPNWLFGPAWTVLYILIGIAGWRIWLRDRRSAAMALWGTQLALNFLWSPVFFGLHQIGAGLVLILLLLVAILGFIGASCRVDRTAAILFLPYAAWVGFASALNAGIWRLNG